MSKQKGLHVALTPAIPSWFDSCIEWIRRAGGVNPGSDTTHSDRSPPGDSLFEMQVRAHPTRLMEPFLIKNGVTTEQFVSFCDGFARGVRYVRQRFGAAPKTIVLTDEELDSPYYNIDTESIFVPRRFILNCITTGFLRQTKTEPLILPYDQMAMMYGVEEAFHHYELRLQRDRHASRKTSLIDGLSHDDKSALERSAKRVVREALQDFNLIDGPVANCNVDSEDLEWLKAAQHRRQLLTTKFKDRLEAVSAGLNLPGPR